MVDDVLGAAESVDVEHKRIAPIVPARRLVQWTYCRRLGILEWLHGEFEANHFTVEGAHIHRRVDRPGASLAGLSAKVAAELAEIEVAEGDPAGDGEDTGVLASRSVYLESEREGLVAKMDLVELVADGSNVVIPVETKRGKPPREDQDPAGTWEEDRVQVCAQALILRDHGYVCDTGYVYYATVRRRFEVAIDDALVAHTRALLADLVATAEAGVLPPPLVHSAKCRGCSLAGICLPDETILLAAEAGEGGLDVDAVEKGGFDDNGDDVVDRMASDDGPLDDDDSGDGPGAIGLDDRPKAPRILVADGFKRPLYMTDSASRLGVEKGVFVIKKYVDDKLTVLGKVRVRDTSHVAVFGRGQVSTMALREAMDRGIPVSYFTFGGYFVGSAVGHSHKNVVLREAQWRAALDTGASLAIAKEIVRAKIRNQRTMLRRNATGMEGSGLREMADLAARVRGVEAAESLLGLEGAAAAVYFREFGRMLKPRDEDAALAFDFGTRNRRPPRDPVNALLSLVYSLLSRECAAVLGAVGFDALMGFYHRPRYGRPALALDLMEEFRPLVADSVVLSVVNQGEVGPTDFVTRADGCNLTEGGRRAVLRAYERRMGQEVTHPVFGYRASWRRVLEIQARLLGKYLLGEVPRYVPMETR